MTTFGQLAIGDRFVWGAALPGLRAPAGGPFTKVSARRYSDAEGKVWTTGSKTAVMLQADAHVSGGGTVYLVHPLSQAAKDWIQEHVGGETQYLGDALAVEHRYIGDLVAGMQADGLTVR